MTDWIQTISQAMASVNRAVDAVKDSITHSLGIQDPINVLPYRGYGTPERLYLKGRVLRDEGIKLREQHAPLWKNLWSMYKRFETDEVVHAHLRVSLGNFQQEIETDDEGFFEVTIQPQPAIDDDRLWQPIDLELLQPQPPPCQGHDRAQALVVHNQARFGVISDIDDTIVYTAATDVLKMIRIAYLGNSKTRKPFDGVAEFYHALQQGQNGEGNPIFYVSSSAWNMYDLFAEFMDFNQIPPGPILLRDIELAPDNLLSFKHERYKLEQIQPIFENFPQLQFILIGDSGQKDAEIYRNLANTYPNRILAVYIRNVTPNNRQRDRELEAIATDIKEQGGQLVVFNDTSEAMAHAASQGWIAT
ncbi:MAG: DUF2183 domain-containing protein [Elainellaceae cyanobacterium]